MQGCLRKMQISIVNILLSSRKCLKYWHIDGFLTFFPLPFSFSLAFLLTPRRLTQCPHQNLPEGLPGTKEGTKKPGLFCTGLFCTIALQLQTQKKDTFNCYLHLLLKILKHFHLFIQNVYLCREIIKQN